MPLVRETERQPAKRRRWSWGTVTAILLLPIFILVALPFFGDLHLPWGRHTLILTTTYWKPNRWERTPRHGFYHTRSMSGPDMATWGVTIGNLIYSAHVVWNFPQGRPWFRPKS